VDERSGELPSKEDEVSDYWPDLDSLRADFPLFAAVADNKQARAFHERDETQASVLATLRAGDRLTKKDYEAAEQNGSRLAPVIEQLRNAHGFKISGHGTVKKPYYMQDLAQSPSLARVTPEMKVSYYRLPHWLRAKACREAMDYHRCVLCHALSELRCHHVSYANLFNEPHVDLLTLCDRCHGRVHENCGLKFPSGVSIQYAHWLGWKGFEEWLLP
jgi:hypothetical protein